MRRRAVWVLLAGWAALSGCSPRGAAVVDVAAAEASSPPVKKAEGGAPAKKEEPAGPFRLPADIGGRLLAEELAPAPPAPFLEPARPAGFQEPAPPRLVEPPPPPATLPAPARAAAPARKRAAERLLLDEMPEDVFVLLAVPREQAFAAGRRARVPSPDPEMPPPLPAMATAQPPDRVPVEDASADVSTAAALTGRPTRRSAAAPYARGSVPDPYEHRQPLTANALEEGKDIQAPPRAK